MEHGGTMMSGQGWDGSEISKSEPCWWIYKDKRALRTKTNKGLEFKTLDPLDVSKCEIQGLEMDHQICQFVHFKGLEVGFNN